jgi:hypothetical protein
MPTIDNNNLKQAPQTQLKVTSTTDNNEERQAMDIDIPNEKEQETFTRLHVGQIVLNALQASDPDTCLLVPADTFFQ